MTQSVVQIITAIANQAAAIALSTPVVELPEVGLPQASFTAMATTSATGHGPAPTHCWTNGWMDDTLIALFEADVSKYIVTRFPNRQALNALSAYSPTLYPYLGT